MYPPPHRTKRPGEGQAPIQGQGKYFAQPEAAWHSNTLGMWHSLLLAQEWAEYGHKQSWSSVTVGDKGCWLSTLILEIFTKRPLCVCAALGSETSQQTRA